MKKLTTKLIFLSIVSLILSTVIPRTILILTDQSPDREVLKSMIVLWAVIVTGIIALILYSFIIKFLIINRINKISEHTINVTQGYFDNQIEIKGNDEISVLAKNFNIMTKTLKDHFLMNKQYVQNVSHEIKTPITSIKGYADMIMLDTNLSNESKEYLQIISEEAKRLSHMSQSLLELSKIQNTTIIHTNDVIVPAEEIRKLFVLYQTQWESSKLNIHFDLVENKIFTNKQLFYTVIKNLIENAIYYTPEGGTIDIKQTLDNNLLHISISNLTKNMTNMSIDQLMEPYQRGTHQRKESTGLGLSIVKSAIDALQGSLDIILKENMFIATIKLKQLLKTSHK